MPSLTSPIGTPASARMSASSWSVSRTQPRTRVSMCCPRSVSTTPRPVRRNNAPPQADSSSLIWRLIWDCTVWRWAAALVKLPSSATSRKSRKSFGFMPSPQMLICQSRHV
ncbi:hypothetical protein D9M68_872880 [compost metagenome]